MHRGVVRRAAFTLIELLTVIAIIAVLATLAFTATRGVMEKSRRAQCMSNLRQLGAGVMTYAANHDGEVPLGYRSGNMKFNTMLHAGPGYVLLGRLWAEKIITNPKTFYCPSETAPAQAFNSSVNRWPPQGNVQGGYACHPLVDWKAAPEPPRYPRLMELAGQAMLADGCGSPERVDSRHQDGVNVLYANGSVRWIKRDLFDPELRGGNIPRIWEIFAEQ